MLRNADGTPYLLICGYCDAEHEDGTHCDCYPEHLENPKRRAVWDAIILLRRNGYTVAREATPASNRGGR